MKKEKPFLGTTSDRSKAFMGIDKLVLNVVQDRWDQYSSQGWQRERRYSLDDVPRYLGCLNPRCQQGGLDLQKIVMFWPSGQHTMHCGGHEGSPAGRRKGDPCDNSFVVTIDKAEEGR